ncbi:AAA family ATPase [Microbacterium sp.]|uniref:ATP-dependent nuclease n=1 Tax=Microbacterium sp. TaxID=51671 RepID=UPI001ACEAC19|nr:AAA family ATPase [Microbacterium sp.]MBN9157054.1 AAA family ATPase [Microbacterium sp.]
MSATTAITSLTLNDGTRVDLQESGVVLFVGPNNAGKSQALRDIAKIATSGDTTGVVVRSAAVEYRGTAEELIEQMTDDRAIINSPTTGAVVDLGDGSIQPVSNIQSWWGGVASHILGRYFVFLADTESRLHASKPTSALDLYTRNPSHPLHRLYLSPALDARLQSISRDAFDRGLILDVWAGGSQWALRVGEIDTPNSPRPDQDYLDALRALPLLHEQGDGVRSMIGLLLTLLTGHQSISLVDEPEAFLHPPQARFLARLLSDDAASESRAVFLSTHSSDIVHGTLEGAAPTTVIRLRRSGDVNEAAVLDNEAVRRLWSDPLLKYSNLLEGLFTDAVVVCESDADCKFFASIRDTLEPASIDARRPDILFTSCGGKHRMHVGLEALRAASVPVVVIGDFDVLNDWGVLSQLIVKAGGTAGEFEKDWRVLNSALTSNARTPSVAGMREAVAAAFDQVTEITPKSLTPVREALKIENGWDRVKNSGLAGVPKGDPYNAASRLLSALRELRIFLIPLGEMEDFVPGVSGHGPAWLSDVLEQRLHESSVGDPARHFFRDVLAAISGAAGAS